MFQPNRVRARTRKGFTLIEMVIVLVILAMVAALVVPRLGFVEEQAGNATSAATLAQLVSNLETYKTTTGSYPNGFDSLVDTDGNLYGDLWTHAPGFGPLNYFEVKTLQSLGGSYATSLGHAFAPDSTGTRYVYDHTPAPAADPDNSAATLRALDTSSSGTANFAFVKKTSTPPLSSFMPSFYRTVGYPNGVPADVELVVFGIGPTTGSIGNTMVSAPSHSEQDTGTYGRYFAVFAIYANGKSAQLKAIVDSHGAGIDSNVNAAQNAAPEHN